LTNALLRLFNWEEDRRNVFLNSLFFKILWPILKINSDKPNWNLNKMEIRISLEFRNVKDKQLFSKKRSMKCRHLFKREMRPFKWKIRILLSVKLKEIYSNNRFLFWLLKMKISLNRLSRFYCYKIKWRAENRFNWDWRNSRFNFRDVKKKEEFRMLNLKNSKKISQINSRTAKMKPRNYPTK